MRWAKYDQSLRDAKVVFIYDTQKNGNVEGLLRGLPALLYSQFCNATCPKSWLQIGDSDQHRLYDYRWHRLQDIDEIDFDLAALTTQYYESNLAVYSLRTLINRYSNSDRKIFIVGDQRSFELAGTVRPLREDTVVDRTFAYEDVYTAFTARYDEYDISLPLQDTKNLFLQDSANIYELAVGEPLRTIEELIDVLPEAPYLPLVKGLSSVFTSRTGVGSEPLGSVKDIEEFGKWLRRRIELGYNEALSIAKTVNGYASDYERLFDPAGRRRMPEMNEARAARRELDHENNPIHERYHTWLSEAL